ncbi:MAG: class I SAM-dependent methyltransferase [Rhodococcus sp. (in: high G+C Gram-positive bacteria)]
MAGVENHHPNASPEHPDLRDYVNWHSEYDDPESSLSVRLRHVQRAILDWLDRIPGQVRVLSSCAGQGHDILGALEQRGPKDRARVTGALLEIDPTNVAIAQRHIARLGLDLSIVETDAGATDAYAGLVPADLVILSGIMGNISATDIERLVHVAPQFCAPAATVIWTRGAQDPDLGPDIRRWFCQAGFEELSCQEWIEGTGMRVGVNRLIASPQALRPGERIFTFYR